MNPINLAAIVHFVEVGACVIVAFGFAMYRWIKY